MTINDVRERFAHLTKINEWQQYHSPKNLVMAASVEMAELMEPFQWLTEDESMQLDQATLAHVGTEIADVLMYVFALSDKLGIDVEQVLQAKIEDNERRFGGAV